MALLRQPGPRTHAAPPWPLTALFLCCIAAGGAWAQGTVATPEPLFIELIVNGRKQGELARAQRQPDGSIWLESAAWERAGLRPSSEGPSLEAGESAVDLSAVPGLRIELDRSAMVLRLDAPAGAFTGSDIGAGAGRQLPAPPQQAAAMLNYDLAWYATPGGGGSRGLFLEAVASTRWGHAVHGYVVNDSPIQRTAQRLETYWRLDRPEHLDSITLGDTISSTGGWSRPVRFAGLRWGRNFQLQPGFVTQPVLTLAGETALPSTVDVLVNNVRRLSVPVEPGPFSIRDVAPLSGAGQVNLVVRDILGRETVTTVGTYASPRLLQPGLTDYSVEVGAIREGFATQSRYGDGFAAASWRAGLHRSLTVETRAEWQADRQAAGVDVAALVAGALSGRAALAVSRGNVQGTGGQGGFAALGIERQGGAGSFSLQWQRASAGFAPMGEAGTADAPLQRLREQVFGSVSFRLLPRWGLSLGVAQQARWSGERSGLATLSLSGPAGRGFLLLSLTRPLGRSSDVPNPGTQALLTLSLPLGNQVWGNASADHRAGNPTRVRAGASRPAPAGPGWGWQAEASNDAQRAARGTLHMNAERIDTSLDIASDSGGEVSTRLGLRGTVGWLGGMVFAARPVGAGSVVLVEAPDVPGVVVRRSSQPVATTNAAGRAVITGVTPWFPTRIELDPVDLPLDLEIREVSREVLPYARSGMVLRFDVRRTRQALLVLHRADGTAVPEGAEVVLRPQDITTHVGLRGEAWLTDLQERDQRVEVRWPAGRCLLTLPPLDPQDLAPTLGPLACDSP